MGKAVKMTRIVSPLRCSIRLRSSSHRYNATRTGSGTLLAQAEMHAVNFYRAGGRQAFKDSSGSRGYHIAFRIEEITTDYYVPNCKSICIVEDDVGHSQTLIAVPVLHNHR